MIGLLERRAIAKELLLKIYILDCDALNFGKRNDIYIVRPTYLRKKTELKKEWGEKPGLEVLN